MSASTNDIWNTAYSGDFEYQQAFGELMTPTNIGDLRKVASSDDFWTVKPSVMIVKIEQHSGEFRQSIRNSSEQRL